VEGKRQGAVKKDGKGRKRGMARARKRRRASPDFVYGFPLKIHLCLIISG
jgi:hypothetical protein